MTKLNGARHPADGSQKPYYDKKLRAIVHNDVHLTPVNKKRLVEREFHTFEVAALEADLVKIDENITLFQEHIAKEEARKEEIKQLIEEGKERDQRLLELLG
jgi:hypothetical protein